jgi:hypothetical protein
MRAAGLDAGAWQVDVAQLRSTLEALHAALAAPQPVLDVEIAAPDREP